MASRSAPARSRYYDRFSDAHGSRAPRCCTPSGLEQTPFAEKALMNWRCELALPPSFPLKIMIAVRGRSVILLSLFVSGGKYTAGVERRNGLKIKPWFK